jgi:hypothetical protein
VFFFTSRDERPETIPRRPPNKDAPPGGGEVEHAHENPKTGKGKKTTVLWDEGFLSYAPHRVSSITFEGNQLERTSSLVSLIFFSHLFGFLFPPSSNQL